MPDYSLVAHARGWLYTREAEAHHLWRCLRRAFPEAHACCLMPDHLHIVLPHADEEGRFRHVRGGFTRWLSSQPRWPEEFGWSDAPEPRELSADCGHLRRLIRYVNLNPCRAGLVRDPLAWAWSTHRDATGFALDPWVRVADADRFHAFVSGDPSVRVDGTSLPGVQAGDYDLAAISRAVGAVCRVSAPQVTHGRPRQLALLTAMAFGHDCSQLLADWSRCTTRQVERVGRDRISRWGLTDDAVLSACLRATGDERFDDVAGDLPCTRAWREYKRVRDARRARRGQGALVGPDPLQMSPFRT
jgi:hypothetical protein